MNKYRLAIIVYNVRSSHNVGSILRSCDGLGVDQVYLTGYTPYPPKKDDSRLPHIQVKVEKQIQKTALGAEKSVSWHQQDNLSEAIEQLKKDGFKIAALEQTTTARDLIGYKADHNLALIVGNEVNGLDEDALDLCDFHLQIPMHGKKESLNVAIAASIAMYHLKFFGQ